ncbi:MAG: site-specific integrase [Chitinophagaceae bacterium]|jgi:integrase
MIKLSINFYLRQPKSKGQKAIYATVRYQRQTAILFPGLSIHSKDWISKKGISKPRDIPENYPIKDKLVEFDRLIRLAHKELQDLQPTSIVSPVVLKKLISSNRLLSEVKSETEINNNNLLISDFFQKLIDDSTNKLRLNNGKIFTRATILSYETTMKHFTVFQSCNFKKYRLTDINQDLIDGFARYLNFDLKMSLNASGKYMKTFRTMMNYGRKLKMVSAELMSDCKVTVTNESPDNIYLSRKDIDDMLALDDLDTPLYYFVRDLFVIACHTGLRFSDIPKVCNTRIENEIIHMTIKKTKCSSAIPVHPVVREILNRYPEGLPKCPPNQVFNRYLKEIGKKLPQLNGNFEKAVTREGVLETKTHKKYELLCSHTARRSFATNEYLNKTPVMTIMAITGHKSEKTFRAYIKLDSLEHAMLLAAKWKVGDENL